MGVCSSPGWWRSCYLGQSGGWQQRCSSESAERCAANLFYQGSLHCSVLRRKNRHMGRWKVWWWQPEGPKGASMAFMILAFVIQWLSWWWDMSARQKGLKRSESKGVIQAIPGDAELKSKCRIYSFLVCQLSYDYIVQVRWHRFQSCNLQGISLGGLW